MIHDRVDEAREEPVPVLRGAERLEHPAQIPPAHENFQGAEEVVVAQAAVEHVLVLEIVGELHDHGRGESVVRSQHERLDHLGVVEGEAEIRGASRNRLNVSNEDSFALGAALRAVLLRGVAIARISLYPLSSLIQRSEKVPARAVQG